MHDDLEGDTLNKGPNDLVFVVVKILQAGISRLVKVSVFGVDPALLVALGERANGGKHCA